MNILRFEDLVAQGRVSGKRVFIRADLNVPLDAAGHITEDTRVRASIPYGIEKDVGCLSTGGGAFPEVLEGTTLPAFENLARRAAESATT